MSDPVSAPIVALSEKSSCLPTWFRRAKAVPQLVEDAVKVGAQVETEAKLLAKAAEPVVAEVKELVKVAEPKVRTCFRSCSACDARSRVAAPAAPSPAPVKVYKKWASCFPDSPEDKSVIPRRERLRCWVKKASAKEPATLEFRSVALPDEQPSAPGEVPAPEPSKSE